MNLKDKFTFEYKGKTIKVEKTGVDVWCAIHPQGEKPDISTPLAFVPVGVGSVDVRKRKDNKLLVCLQLLDITKPEQPKQKEMNKINFKSLEEFQEQLNYKNLCISLKDVYQDSSLNKKLLNVSEIFLVKKAVVSEIGHKCEKKGNHIVIEFKVSRFNQKNDSYIKINTHKKTINSLKKYIESLFGEINY